MPPETPNPRPTGEAYDPQRHDAQLVAAFEQRSLAEAARDALLGAGVPAHVIELIGDASPESEGFWNSVRRLFAPDDEADELGEAVDRGNVMVVVRPETPGEREIAIEVLEGCGPVDLVRGAAPESEPPHSVRPHLVRIVEERMRVGWRDRSGRPSPVRSYVADRSTGTERVELLEEELAPPAGGRPGS